jgi:hypothetical protein
MRGGTVQVRMTEDELRRGLLAILFQPDPDRRGGGSWPWPVIQESRDAYGSDRPRVRFRPSRDDIAIAERIEPYLCCLAVSAGRGAVKALFAWAAGVPTWRLAQERQISCRGMRYQLRRHMRACGVIWDEREAPGHGLASQPAPGSIAENVVPMRVYAAGRYVRNGARVR